MNSQSMYKWLRKIYLFSSFLFWSLCLAILDSLFIRFIYENNLNDNIIINAIQRVLLWIILFPFLFFTSFILANDSLFFLSSGFVLICSSILLYNLFKQHKKTTIKQKKFYLLIVTIIAVITPYFVFHSPKPEDMKGTNPARFKIDEPNFLTEVVAGVREMSEVKKNGYKILGWTKDQQLIYEKKDAQFFVPFIPIERNRKRIYTYDLNTRKSSLYSKKESLYVKTCNQCFKQLLYKEQLKMIPEHVLKFNMSIDVYISPDNKLIAYSMPDFDGDDDLYVVKVK